MENVEIADFTSYLNIRIDRAMPYIGIASAISMIGLIMNFYWQHRRIWVRIKQLFRKPLGLVIQPVLKDIDDEDIDEMSYRAIAIGYPILPWGRRSSP